MTRLNGHERHEWNALLDDANKIDGSTGERGAEALRLLNDAVQAHQPWAQKLIDDWVLAGATAAAKARYKRTSTTPVALKNAKRSRPMVVGAKVQTASGELADQQQLMLDMPWPVVQGRVEVSARQVRDLGFTVATQRKVLALRERCPQSSTPREACDLLGIDFYEYMGTAA